jgi:integrating conjugative element protein (TIGR03761 family)
MLRRLGNNYIRRTDRLVVNMANILQTTQQIADGAPDWFDLLLRSRPLTTDCCSRSMESGCQGMAALPRGRTHQNNHKLKSSRRTSSIKRRFSMVEETIRRTFTQPGPILSTATIQLHTRIAVDLFHGHKGFTWFAANLNKLWDLSLQDDPYADYRLIQVEEQLALFSQYLSHKTEEVEGRLGALAIAGIQPVSHHSVRPVDAPLAFRATQAAAAVLQLAALDRLTQKALMVKHFGLLTESDWQSSVGSCTSAMRDLFAISEHQVSGASRDDFSSKNARSMEARERLGEIPAEIMEGLKRPSLGPKRVK